MVLKKTNFSLTGLSNSIGRHFRVRDQSCRDQKLQPVVQLDSYPCQFNLPVYLSIAYPEFV